MEEKNKTYTVSDFTRYYSGNMPANEMHALEKAALEDPFLADALEGYVYSKSPEKDIAELRGQFAEKRKKKKVFFISSVIQNKWWSVAALFIIILGVGYFFYRTNDNNATEYSLAKNDTQKSPAKVEAPSTLVKDSSTINNDVAFESRQEPKVSRNDKATLPKTNAIIKHEKIDKEPVSETAEAAISLRMAENNYAQDSFNQSKSINKKNTSKQYVLKGRVTDESGAPIPYVSIEDKNQHKIITTDASGHFSLTSPDSTTNVVASGVGLESAAATLQNDKQPVITMNKNEASLSEVVVSGYSKENKKTSLSPPKKLQEKVAGVQITESAFQPFPVNKKFKQYLQENLLPVYDANNERLTGEVVLSFSINKKGRPQDIKVLKSSCKGCEEQAIRLLENGPEWNEKKNVSGTVEIKF
ncbi:MAG: carboxypeptidase-like regulatory domain-containing protein [Ginsengibacter sp.]